MKKRIVVLGAGLVGNAIAIDLSKQFDVTSVDIDSKPLEKLESEHNIKTLNADLSNGETIQKIVSEFDLVIGALPGFMGYKSVENVIMAGKNMVDISFFPEDVFKLDKLAKEKNVCIVVDAGVAPGMGNIILGYHNKKMLVSDYKCFVGGLPVKREWPYEYKSVFSPIDVIEEYIRPAKFIQGNKLITMQTSCTQPANIGRRLSAKESLNPHKTERV